jgi:hypothetical protein
MMPRMLHRGVVERGRLLDEQLASRGRPRRFSLELLEEIDQSYTPADEPLLERIYTEILVSGSVYKTTRRDRFVDVDRRLADEIEVRFPSVDRVAIHDVGASNGITSLELFRLLERRRRIALFASDLFDRLWFVRVRPRPWTVVFSADGAPLQYVGLHLVLSAERERNVEGRRYPVNFAAKRWLDLTLLPTARAILADAETKAATAGVRPAGRGPDEFRFDTRRGTARAFPLVHPEVHACARRTPDFTFGRHDIFEQAPGSHHVVRVMNLLNPNYFGPAKLIEAAAACASSLRQGGLFVVGRTIDEEDARNRVTAFVRAGTRLEPVWDLHEGSEIRSLLAGVQILPRADALNEACTTPGRASSPGAGLE